MFTKISKLFLSISMTFIFCYCGEDENFCPKISTKVETKNSRYCVTYDSHGSNKFHGPYQQWHDNGVLKVDGWYFWGDKCGVWILRDENNAIEDITYWGDCHK